MQAHATDELTAMVADTLGGDRSHVAPLARIVVLGLAVLDAATSHKDDSIRRADTALYRSKDNGRNQTSVG